MKRTVLLLIITLLTACAPYSLMDPGSNTAGPITFDTSIPWNRLNLYKPGAKAEMWTANGQVLDSIIIFKGIEDGEALFKSQSRQDPMPEFSSDMLPQEVLELVKSSMTKYYGENNIILTTGGLKPTRFLNSPGYTFDLKFTDQNGLKYSGKAVAATVDDRLLMMIYTGTQLYYYAKHEEEFEKIITSATL